MTYYFINDYYLYYTINTIILIYGNLFIFIKISNINCINILPVIHIYQEIIQIILALNHSFI